MGIYIVGSFLLIFFIVFVHLLVRNRQKDRRISKAAEEIERLRKEVERMKNRHLTAKGGLSREDSLKMLDLLAKIGMLKDDSDLVNLRIEDLDREVKKMMHKKGDK